MCLASLQHRFDRPAPEVAARLIGWTLLLEGVGGVIVETEAYARDDEASHSFRGPGKTNAAMFGEPGTAYVYRSYGLHLCLNFVCAEASAVLLRALMPTDGQQRMQERRKTDNPRLWCSGPGRLGQALAVGLSLNGASLASPPFSLTEGAPAGPVVAGPRIGISRARDKPWRFVLSGSAFLSRPPPPDSQPHPPLEGTIR